MNATEFADRLEDEVVVKAGTRYAYLDDAQVPASPALVEEIRSILADRHGARTVRANGNPDHPVYQWKDDQIIAFTW